MIVTILPGSSNFHAVGYNEHKVAKGQARLLEMSNMGPVGLFGSYTANEAIDYLRLYSSKNDRIQKAQFHVAFSCKGHEMTEDQLLGFAHAWLKEMGYAEEGQPLLVYSHYDTANTHIHIITSRISPDARKIDHNNERRRSQKVIDKLLGTNIKSECDSDIEDAKLYRFSSLSQFQAILSSLGYECYCDESNENLCVKKGGCVQTIVPIVDIESLSKKECKYGKREKQLRAIFLKYRDLCNNKEELQRDLKKNFGIDLVFYGRRDSPYGYMVVDHREKIVYKGSHILKVKELLNFSSRDEKVGNVYQFISKVLESNPSATTGTINKKLKRSHMWIKRGILYHGEKETPLDPSLAKVISRNDRVALAQSFSPQNKVERSILARIFRIDDYEDMIDIDNPRIDENRVKMEKMLKGMFNIFEGAQLRSSIRGAGIVIKRSGDNCVAINFETKTILHLDSSRFDIGRLYPRPVALTITSGTSFRNSNIRVGMKAGNISKAGNNIQGSDANREWEVGKKSKYDDMDDHIDSGLKI